MTGPPPGLRWPLDPDDLPAMCDRLEAALRAAGPDPDPVACDVARAPATLRTVEALARLALVCQRCGRRLRAAGASPALAALIDLAGLGGVIRPERRPGPAGGACRTTGTGSPPPGRT
ncbi:MAG: STAS domain-containing protein [Thermoleophilia bacterium]|nr:STAS domain-containing protein [Thermoleophilia bacterium]